MDKLDFKIVQEIAVLSEKDHGWAKEINLVKWNNQEAKYDIRSWSADHTRMSKGVTLTKDELKQLKTVLEELF